jgi:hypothetical protein
MDVQVQRWRAVSWPSPRAWLRAARWAEAPQPSIVVCPAASGSASQSSTRTSPTSRRIPSTRPFRSFTRVLQELPLVGARVLCLAADDTGRKGPILECVIVREGHGCWVQHACGHELVLRFADFDLSVVCRSLGV